MVKLKLDKKIEFKMTVDASTTQPRLKKKKTSRLEQRSSSFREQKIKGLNIGGKKAEKSLAGSMYKRT